MFLKKSPSLYKNVLLVTTILTSVAFLQSSTAFAVDETIDGLYDIDGIYTTNTKKSLAGVSEAGVIQGNNKYVFESGSTLSSDLTLDLSSDVSSPFKKPFTTDLSDEALSAGDNSKYEAEKFSNGIYQHSEGGIVIKASGGAGTAPQFDFTKGGVIWDDTAYSTSLRTSPLESLVLSNGVVINGIEKGSDINIYNGIFKGNVDIRKGNSQGYFSVKSTDEDGGVKTFPYEIKSRGNINVSGGEFYLYNSSSTGDIATGGSSQIYIYDTNSAGVVNVSGGDFFVGCSGKGVSCSTDHRFKIEVPNTNEETGAINITGGNFYIAQGNTMELKATSGSFVDTDSFSNFSGEGTLEIYARENFTIGSDIVWTTGTINQTWGDLSIDSNVQIKTFKQESQTSALTLNGTLSILNDLNIVGSLKGSGQLKLESNASATFGTLVDFGTITADKGVVSFTNGESSLGVLNGGNGLINVSSKTKIETINLQNSTLFLEEQLTVSTLNFEDGTVVFTRSDTPLVLLDSTTIYNTTSLITSGGAVQGKDVVNGNLVDASYTPTEGTLMINDGLVLTFADKEGTDDSFKSDNLIVSVKGGASAVFNSKDVSFKTLDMTYGTATVQSGTLSLSELIVGESINSTGTFTVNAGAKAEVTSLEANIGGKLVVNGTLDVANLEMEGNQHSSQYSVITGTGTVNVSGISNFGGIISNLNILNVKGDTANAVFKGYSGQDIISYLNVTEGGTITIEQGKLTLVSMLLDNGTVDIGAGATLAISQDPNELFNPTASNTIKGNGTLELLNKTNISFGGKGLDSYLGGLKIHGGTATITDDFVLGNVHFSNEGGALDIASGKTLTLASKPVEGQEPSCFAGSTCSIEIYANDSITGGGTLKLVDGSNSVFGGAIDVGSIDFAGNGKITFNYAGLSTLGELKVNSAGSTVVVDTGRVNIEDDFGNVNTQVYGTGTLGLYGASSSFYNNGKSLANLVIGTGVVNVGNGTTLGTVSFEGENGVLNNLGNTTITDVITLGATNSVKGNTLTLDSAIGNFNSSLTDLNTIAVTNGSTAYINKSTSIGSNFDLTGASQAVIASGAVLTLDQASIGDATSVITGNGTLAITLTSAPPDVTVNAVLKNLNKLKVVENQTTLKSTSSINTVEIADTSALIFNGGVISGNASIGDGSALTATGNSQIGSVSMQGSSNLQISENTQVGTITTSGSSTLQIADSKQLTVNNNLELTRGDSILTNESGTLLLNGASNNLSITRAFDGLLLLGLGTTNINADFDVAKLKFNGSGGALNITGANTLKVEEISTTANNNVTGTGTLNVTKTGSFGASIASLGKLMLDSGADATISKTANISQVENNGALVVSGTLNVLDSMTGSGVMTGTGSLVLGTGTAAFLTGTGSLNQVYIGTGALNVLADSTVNTLNYQKAGTLDITAGKNLTVASSFTGLGTITGAGTLNIEDANLSLSADTYTGSMSAKSGTVRFNSEVDMSMYSAGGSTTFFKDVAKLDTFNVETGKVDFKNTASITDFNLTSGGLVLFENTADITNFDVSGNGTVIFQDVATLDTLNVSSGIAYFNKNSTIASASTVGASGTLDVDINRLTFSDDLEFQDNSAFALRISKDATNNAGTVNEDGYGQIALNSGTLTVGKDVSLDVTIDYGVEISTAGSIFKFVDGNVAAGSDFTFENNRYGFVSENCTSGSGLCYSITKIATAEDVANNQGGNQNNADTAEAFLDSEVFEEGSDIYEIAEHLDDLSQDTTKSKKYVNALTALAPDVSNAMSRSTTATHSKIASTINTRLNSLMRNMGTASNTYQSLQKMYGRSGGSPYRSRFMSTDDYYRRAGYYDEAERPASMSRPTSSSSYYGRYSSEMPEVDEPQRDTWTTNRLSAKQPNRFGAWAQTFLNTSEYLSSDDPEGFASDTTGVAFGADVQVLDVLALGFGYASTSTSVDTLQRKTDMTGDSLFVYGMYKPVDWYISSIVNFTSQSYEEEKDISGIMLSDTYDGSSLAASVMFGRDLRTWSPVVGLRYVSSKRDAHVDEIGQDISSVSSSAFTLVAEARMNRVFAQSNAGFWNAELSGGLTYDISSSGEDAVVSLPNNSSYVVEGEDFEPLGLELGGTVSYVLGEHVDISAGYNLDVRSDYMSHTLTATFRYAF